LQKLLEWIKIVFLKMSLNLELYGLQKYKVIGSALELGK
jgi:hypothetical protein